VVVVGEEEKRIFVGRSNVKKKIEECAEDDDANLFSYRLLLAVHRRLLEHQKSIT